jgi:hypothetical protein
MHQYTLVMTRPGLVGLALLVTKPLTQQGRDCLLQAVAGNLLHILQSVPDDLCHIVGIRKVDSRIHQ